MRQCLTRDMKLAGIINVLLILLGIIDLAMCFVILFGV